MDGAVIHVSYHGTVDIGEDVWGRIRAGDDVPASEYYLRGQPVFETGSEEYDWLDRIVVISAGKQEAMGVTCDVSPILWTGDWRNPMLKFMLASRSKPGHTKERYFFEWGIIHVALMITTPTVMSTFRRYAQHYVPDGLDGDRLLFPFSTMAWENMADHWLETWDDLVLPFKASDYPDRMQPHNFGDSNFDLQLMTGEELYADDGHYSGGVKLVHFLRRREDVSLDDFTAKYRAHGDALVEGGRGILRKYVQNIETQGDPAYFTGTLFELGSVNRYAGVEELWFDDVAAVYAFCGDPERRATLLGSYAGFVDDGAYSMVTTERVVFDFVTPGHISPPPAVLQAGSLESLVDAQGYTGWWVPGWDKRARGVTT